MGGHGTNGLAFSPRHSNNKCGVVGVDVSVLVPTMWFAAGVGVGLIVGLAALPLVRALRDYKAGGKNGRAPRAAS